MTHVRDASRTEPKNMAANRVSGPPHRRELRSSNDEQRESAAPQKALGELAAAARTSWIPKAAPRRRISTATWVTALIVTQVVIIAAAATWFYRPTWEDKNRKTLLAMKSDADALVKHGDAKAAYHAYQRLFTFVGDNEVQILQNDIAVARASMEQAYRTARPLIEKEEAEARAREQARLREEAERQQLETQRLAAERAAIEQRERVRRSAEAAQAEEERRRVGEKARQIKLALARAEFQKSAEYIALKAKADSVVRVLAVDMATEDSAYRGISRRSQAARDVLAAYVKIQSKLRGTDVGSQVDVIVARAESDVAFESSAIRAIYKHDAAFFHLLGVWCGVLEDDHSGLAKAYRDEARKIELSSIGDDSAVREISRFTAGSLSLLRQILESTGEGSAAKQVKNRVELANSGDNSAWREAMNNAEGIAELMLLLLEKRDADAARRIRTATEAAVRFDESALRAHGSYKQATVEAIHRLLSMP